MKSTGTTSVQRENLSCQFDEREDIMKIANPGHVLAFACVLSLVAAFSLGVQAAEYKPKAEVKSLYEGVLTGVDGKNVIIKHFTLPAGFVGGKHFHPADVFVYVLEGELTVETADGVQTISTGELYPEVPGMVMVGKNVSADNPTKIVVFQVGDAGKPMMVKAD
jgi:quercetin dioxygenase-like cupin family protein